MDLSINALVERVGDFLYEKGTLLYRFHAGLSTELPLTKLHQAFTELTQVETFVRVEEMLKSPRIDEQRKVGLSMLLQFLGELLEDVRAAHSHEAIAQMLATAPVGTGGQGTLPLGEALARMATDGARERREVLETQSAEVLWAARGTWARRVEAAMALANELKFDGYLALRERLTGVAVGPLAQSTDEVLRSTHDAFFDLTTYALKRSDPTLKLEHARLHDLLRAASAPWMMELFRKEDLLPSITRWLGDLGYDPNASGRLSFDSEDRPGKRTGAFVAELRVPDELRLIVLPRPGFNGYAELMRTFGHALHRASASRSTPVLERRLGDGAVPRALSSLFENVLLDEAWHRRYLRMTQAQSREAARLFAFHQLLELRWKAALLPYAIELYRAGPSDELAEHYEERLKNALLVTMPKARFLYDVKPQLMMVEALRGWALEAVLHERLRERFNEDFWRNPATGRWLQELSANGQRDNADAVAKVLGADRLSLPQAGARLVQVMGA